MYLQKNRKLHEFATTNIFFLKNRHFQTCIIVKRTCISIFSKIGLVDQSKTCTQIYLQKFLNCNNLQLAIRISKHHAFRTCNTPLRTFRPILRSIGLLDIEIPRKEIISTDDRRTDGQTSRTTTIGSFSKKEKTTKKGNKGPDVLGVVHNHVYFSF